MCHGCVHFPPCRTYTCSTPQTLNRTRTTVANGSMLRFHGNAWRSRAVDSRIEMVRAWPEDCGHKAAHCRFGRGCGGPDISLVLGLFLGSNSEAKTGQSKANAKRSAAPVSGAPLDGGHAERAAGVARASGVEVACGDTAEDEENDAIDAAHEEVMDCDEGRRAGAGRCRGHVEGLCKQVEGFMRSRTMSLSRAMWRSLRRALRARRRTRGASSASTATIDVTGSGDAWPGPAVPVLLVRRPLQLHVASVRWRDRFST